MRVPNRYGLAGLALAVLLSTAVVPLCATTMAPMDLTELVAGSRAIVYGRVVSVRAEVSGGRTETVVTLGVPAFLKGEGGPEVVFRVPGGQIGRYRTVVVGAPVLQPGDEVVAFLLGDVERATIVGFSQGLVRVVRPSSAAAPMVLSPPAARDGETAAVVRGAGARRFVPLATFVADVRTLVTSAPGAAVRTRRSTGSSKMGGF